MLTITRKYTIGIQPSSSEEVENKLKDLNISITRTDYHSVMFGDVELIRKYYDCVSTEEEMIKLIEYFQHNFGGIAGIIY